MEEQKSVSKSVITTAISAFAVVATLAGGGVAWMMTHNNRPTQTITTSTSVVSPQVTAPTVVAPIVTAPNPPTATNPVAPATTVPNIAQNPANVAPAEQGKVKVFWIDENNKKISVSSQERKVAAATVRTPEGYATESLKMLLAATGKEGQQTSTIPAGTKLLGSQLKNDGLHIDLSKEFTAGGGSTSMQGRLAQILYTATSRTPDMPVWISVEGKQLEALGGEGVEINQPLTRSTFQQEFKDSVGE